MKRCPFCAEEIQDEAIKCRYCGSDLQAPPRMALESISLDDKGGTMKFSNSTVESVADALERFFTSNGFTLETGDKFRGTYGLGSKGVRVFAGGLVKRKKYEFSLTQLGNIVEASVASAISGWSGSVVGAIREKQGRKAFNAQLQAFFLQYR